MKTRFVPIRAAIAAGMRRWWFLALIVLAQLVPTFASRGYRLQDWGAVNAYILTHTIKSSAAGFFPLFQVIALVLCVALFSVGSGVGRFFSVFVGLSYFIDAFLQNISISDRYGLAICSANVIVFLGLAGLWFWEAAAPKNRFEVQARPVWRYWPFLPAILAFWEPVNPITLAPDFNPVYLLTSGAALSFCLATPLYLAVLCIHFPQVNKSVLIATAFTGALMALGNLVLEFVILPDYWWIGILHMPLLILSCYAIMLSHNNLAAGMDSALIQASTNQVTGLDRQDVKSS